MFLCICSLNFTIFALAWVKLVHFKTLDDFNVKSKTVIVRVDFNTEVDPTSKWVSRGLNIVDHAKFTITELAKKGAKIVVLAHQNFSDTDFKQCVEYLQYTLKFPVKYVNDLFGEEAKGAIRQLQDGEIVVLKNVHSWSEETKTGSPEQQSKTALVQNLAPLADLFVNDAFTVAHCNHVSVVGFTAVLPSAAGRIMERELKSLNALEKSQRPRVYVLGGAKIKDNLEISEYVLNNNVADTLLLGGVFSRLFMVAKDPSLGSKSRDFLVKNDLLIFIPIMQKLLAKHHDKIMLPVDVALNVDGKRVEISINQLHSEYLTLDIGAKNRKIFVSPHLLGSSSERVILDIGAKTVENYVNILSKAQSIVVKGVIGDYDNPNFCYGTETVFETIANNGAFNLVCGDDTSAPFDHFGLSKKIRYISTAGGALKEVLMGKKLSGVVALETAAETKKVNAPDESKEQVEVTDTKFFEGLKTRELRMISYEKDLYKACLEIEDGSFRYAVWTLSHLVEHLLNTFYDEYIIHTDIIEKMEKITYEQRKGHKGFKELSLGAKFNILRSDVNKKSRGIIKEVEIKQEKNFEKLNELCNSNFVTARNISVHNQPDREDHGKLMTRDNVIHYFDLISDVLTELGYKGVKFEVCKFRISLKDDAKFDAIRMYSKKISQPILVLPIPDKQATFESVCKDVLSVKYGLNFEIYGERGRPQKGIDLYAEHNDGLIVAQCKNYAKSESIARLIAIISDDISLIDQITDVTKVVILTTHRRDRTVQEEIIQLNQALERKFKINVMFWDDIEEIICDDLTLLKKHFPALVSSIRSLTPYNPEKYRANSVVQLDKWKREIDSVLRKDNEYIPMKIKDCSSEYAVEDILTKLKEKICSHTLLIGASGLGKTTTCIRLWDTCLKKNMQTFYVPLRVYTSTNTIHRNLVEVYGVDESSYNHLMDNENVVLLLDGFDEMEPVYNQIFLEELSKLVTKKRVQILITSRSNVVSAITNDFTLLTFEPIVKTDINEKFKKQIQEGLYDFSRKEIGFFAWLCVVRVLPFLIDKLPITFNMPKDESSHIKYSEDSTDCRLKLEQLYRVLTAADIIVAYSDDTFPYSEVVYRVTYSNFVKSMNTFSIIPQLINMDFSTRNKDSDDANDTAVFFALYTAFYIVNVTKDDDATSCAAVCATFADFDGYKGLRPIFLKDLEAIKNRKHNFQNNTALYGAVWDKFQNALRNLGCEYWGNWYTKIFAKGFILDDNDREEILTRLTAPSDVISRGATGVANYMIGVKAYKSLYDVLLRNFYDHMRDFDYHSAFILLPKLKKANERNYNKLVATFAFVFDHNKSIEHNEANWNRDKTDIDYKVRLWSLLTFDLPAMSEEQSENELPPAEPDTEDIGAKTPNSNVYQPDESIVQTKHPQVIGETLEKNVMELLKELFSIDAEESEQVLNRLIDLRRQHAGYQFGFDIQFTYTDTLGSKCVCMVECKDVKEITLQAVMGKLEQARRIGLKIDHWIIISPNGKVADELSLSLKLWEEENRWLPIQKVQLWERDNEAPDSSVEVFFGLSDVVHNHYYGSDKKIDPNTWTAEDRSRVVNVWKQKLEPALPLPKAWRDYLRNYANLLTISETGDPNASNNQTANDYYEERYRQRVLMPCSGEDPTLMKDKSAEEYIKRWVSESANNSILFLLGGFGDGKTFLTYSLARQLAEDFLKSPAKGVIPIRLTLKDLNEDVSTNTFLEERLTLFGATLSQWRNICNDNKFKVLMILDGFDEMSNSIYPDLMAENIGRLCNCINNYRGQAMRIIVTSRTGFLKTEDKTLFDQFDQPYEILRLGRIAEPEIIKYLSLFTAEKGSEAEKRFNEVCKNSELLSLASKPFLLEMLKEYVRTGFGGEIKKATTLALYEHYAKGVLGRKKRNQYSEPRHGVFQSSTIKNLEYFLEVFALVSLIPKYSDGASLDDLVAEFPKEYTDFSYAQMLWEKLINPTSDEEEDAKNRVLCRSILQEGKIEGRYVFFHRSMKEYFAAQGICRLLEADDDGKAKILSKTELTPETFKFAGEILKKLFANDVNKVRADKVRADKVKKNLETMIEKTRFKSSNDEVVCLGTTALNLYFAALKKLPDIDDWSNLVLDNAHLPEADFRGKTLIRTSLKYANLDNANFTDVDLTDCDLTGVKFEETKNVYAMKKFTITLDDKPCLYVCYSDGTVRGWGNPKNKCQEQWSVKGIENTQGIENDPIIFDKSDIFGLLLLQNGRIHFARKTDKTDNTLDNTRGNTIEVCGRIDFDNSKTILDLKNGNVLFSITSDKFLGKEPLSTQLSFFNVTEQTYVFENYPIVEQTKGVIINDTSVLLFNDPKGPRIITLYEKKPVEKFFTSELDKQNAKDITAISSVIDDSVGVLFVCVGSKTGKLVLYKCENECEEKITPVPIITYSCDKYVKSICCWTLGNGSISHVLYTSDDGIIYVLELDDGELVETDKWRLAVNCNGAKIKGVKQDVQRNKLKEYGGIEQ
jgi:phosphoglycerate kinase